MVLVTWIFFSGTVDCLVICVPAGCSVFVFVGCAFDVVVGVYAFQEVCRGKNAVLGAAPGSLSAQHPPKDTRHSVFLVLFLCGRFGVWMCL